MVYNLEWENFHDLHSEGIVLCLHRKIPKSMLRGGIIFHGSHSCRGWGGIVLILLSIVCNIIKISAMSPVTTVMLARNGPFLQ